MPLRSVLWRSVLDFAEDDMLSYAAALSYQLLFALFPFLIFLLALLSFLNLGALFDWILEQARLALPGPALEQVETVVTEIRDQASGGLLSFGILGAVWIASSGMRSAMNALNRAYDLKEGRSIWRRYALSMVYTVLFAALVVLATLLFVVGPQLTAWGVAWLGLPPAAASTWSWLGVPAALLAVMIAAALVYQFAPNVEQRFQLVTPGSVVAVVLWALISWLFRLYVAHFGRYSVTYGSIGAVIILLLYFYLSAAALLFGGEVNGTVQKAVREGRAPEGDSGQAEGPADPAASAASAAHRTHSAHE